VFSLDPRPSEATIRERIHITQQYAKELPCIGGPAITPAFPSIRLADSCSHKRWQLLIHPGSGGAAKCWPVDRFLELASQLSDLAIAWMVGPVECERAPDAVDAIRKHASRYHHDVITEPDLGSAVCSLACANLYLGNDSGMTHMAAAARCEVIALFGPTDPAIWRPLGKSVRVIAADRQHAHMSAISVDQVAEAIQQML
jgi:ADP-heptose:LPS heptosyltransferase